MHGIHKPVFTFNTNISQLEVTVLHPQTSVIYMRKYNLKLNLHILDDFCVNVTAEHQKGE